MNYKGSLTNSTAWYYTPPFDYPTLSQEIEIDFCIIGSGIAGLMTAYKLLQENKKVAVVESKKIGSGETHKTTAHLSNALDDYYFRIKKMHGLKNATLAAQSHSYAVDYIESIVKKHTIDCDFFRVDGYLFSAGGKSHDLKIRKEHAVLREVGLKEVKYFDSRKGSPLAGKHLLFSQQAQFHPLKYLYALAQIITSHGGLIFEHTHATKILRFDSKLKVTTETPFSIIANHVVATTNAPFQGSLKLHAKLVPNRTYAMGAIVPKNSVQQALYWDTAKPYHYVRLQPIDETNDLLIVGGEDHRTGTPPTFDPYLKLEEWARHYFPSIQSIPYRWSGQVLEPIDYLAYIGKHPKLANVYIATGDSGHGMTHGAIASLIISDLIAKRPNTWASLYNPDRFSYKALKNFLSHNFTTILSYLRHFLFVNHKKIASLKNDESVLLQCGLKKIAFYKDNNGNLHSCSAICSHLQSILRWNTTEKTWDCPAHGSRFDMDGNVLNGPANKSIECAYKEDKI